MLNRVFTKILAKTFIHFDVVLSVFIHPCTKKVEESSIQYSRRVDAAVCVLHKTIYMYISFELSIHQKYQKPKNIHIKILKDRTLLQFTFTF